MLTVYILRTYFIRRLWYERELSILSCLHVYDMRVAASGMHAHAWQHPSVHRRIKAIDEDKCTASSLPKVYTSSRWESSYIYGIEAGSYIEQEAHMNTNDCDDSGHFKTLGQTSVSWAGRPIQMPCTRLRCPAWKRDESSATIRIGGEADPTVWTSIYRSEFFAIVFLLKAHHLADVQRCLVRWRMVEKVNKSPITLNKFQTSSTLPAWSVTVRIHVCRCGWVGGARWRVCVAVSQVDCNIARRLDLDNGEGLAAADSLWSTVAPGRRWEEILKVYLRRRRIRLVGRVVIWERERYRARYGRNCRNRSIQRMNGLIRRDSNEPDVSAWSSTWPRA